MTGTMLQTAAVLAFSLMVLHSILGERYILVRLFRRDNLPKLFGGDSFTKGTLRFCWHIMSVFGISLGAILWILSEPQDTHTIGQIKQVICAGFTASAALAFGLTRGKHLSWIVFGAIAALVYFDGF